MTRSIFISYRRDDSEGEAGRLFDDLTHAFGENSIFMDVSGIDPGVDFRKAIDENVSGCGVLLAIIGPMWATIQNSSGRRRLEDENDFVRLEIASALRRNIAVIPVLVHEAKMPRPDQLPDDLKELAFRNSVEITHARWNSDVALLIKALEPYVAATRSGGTKPVHATVPVQLPAPYPARSQEAPASRSRLPLIAGIAIAVVLAGFAGFAVRRHLRGQASTPPASPSTGSSSAPAATTATGAAAPPATALPASSGTVPAAGTQPVAQPSTPSASGNSSTPWVGTWLREGFETEVQRARRDQGVLVRLAVTRNADASLSMEAWVTCGSRECSWGKRPAHEANGGLKARFHLSEVDNGQPVERTSTITLEPKGQSLLMHARNRLSNGTEGMGVGTFVRPTPAG